MASMHVQAPACRDDAAEPLPFHSAVVRDDQALGLIALYQDSRRRTKWPLSITSRQAPVPTALIPLAWMSPLP